MLHRRLPEFPGGLRNFVANLLQAFGGIFYSEANQLQNAEEGDIKHQALYENNQYFRTCSINMSGLHICL